MIKTRDKRSLRR